MSGAAERLSLEAARALATAALGQAGGVPSGIAVSVGEAVVIVQRSSRSIAAYMLYSDRTIQTR